MVVSVPNVLGSSGTERLRKAEKALDTTLEAWYLSIITINKQHMKHIGTPAYPHLVLHTSAMLLMTIAMMMP